MTVSDILYITRLKANTEHTKKEKHLRIVICLPVKNGFDLRVRGCAVTTSYTKINITNVHKCQKTTSNRELFIHNKVTRTRNKFVGQS